MQSLFTPLAVGALTLPNRIIMAPLTRARAGATRTPNALMAECDSNPAAAFGYVARELSRRKIAFLCAREYVGAKRLGPDLKKAFGGVYIANEQFTQESAEQAIAAGAPLNAPDPATFYAPGAKGCTDYPALQPEPATV